MSFIMNDEHENRETILKLSNSETSLPQKDLRDSQLQVPSSPRGDDGTIVKMTELSKISKTLHSNLSDPSFFKQSKSCKSKLSEPIQEQEEPESVKDELNSVIVNEEEETMGGY